MSPRGQFLMSLDSCDPQLRRGARIDPERDRLLALPRGRALTGFRNRRCGQRLARPGNAGVGQGRTARHQTISRVEGRDLPCSRTARLTLTGDTPIDQRVSQCQASPHDHREHLAAQLADRIGRLLHHALADRRGIQHHGGGPAGEHAQIEAGAHGVEVEDRGAHRHQHQVG